MEDTFEVMGADDFITKPFESQELVNKAEYFLNRIKEETRPGVSQEALAGETDQDEPAGNTEKAAQALKSWNIDLLTGVALIAVMLVIAIFLLARISMSI